MLIPLTTWAKKTFNPVPKIEALRRFARTNQISPPAKRVGRDWYVDENAEFIGPPKISTAGLSPLAKKVIEHGG